MTKSNIQVARTMRLVPSEQANVQGLEALPGISGDSAFKSPLHRPGEGCGGGGGGGPPQLFSWEIRGQITVISKDDG